MHCAEKRKITLQHVKLLRSKAKSSSSRNSSKSKTCERRWQYIAAHAQTKRTHTNAKHRQTTKCGMSLSSLLLLPPGAINTSVTRDVAETAAVAVYTATRTPEITLVIATRCFLHPWLRRAATFIHSLALRTNRKIRQLKTSPVFCLSANKSQTIVLTEHRSLAFWRC